MDAKQGGRREAKAAGSGSERSRFKSWGGSHAHSRGGISSPVFLYKNPRPRRGFWQVVGSNYGGEGVSSFLGKAPMVKKEL